MTGLLAKAALFLPTLLIARTAVPALGVERYGVLMTVLSLLALIALADLGVGSSLVTRMSQALGRGDRQRTRVLQTNGLVVVAGMSGLLLLASVLLQFTNAGRAMLPSSSPAIQAEATMALSAFMLTYALMLPGAVVAKAQLALQRGHVANLWIAAGALLNYAFGWLALEAGFGVPVAILALTGGSVLCGAMNTAVHLTRNPDLRLKRADVDRAESMALVRDGGHYLALQLVFIVAYGLDTLIVARQLGAGTASSYALAERMFSIVAVAVSTITAPLWASYGEAFGRGDRGWVRRTMLSSTQRIGLASVLASLVLVAVAPFLLALLSGGKLALPASALIAMAVWRVVEALGASLTSVLLALGDVRFLLAVGGLTAAVSLVGKWLAVPMLGPLGIPITMTLCYLFLCLVPVAYRVKRAI